MFQSSCIICPTFVVYQRSLLVDIQVSEDLAPQECMKDISVGDDNDDNAKNDEDGKQNAA